VTRYRAEEGEVACDQDEDRSEQGEVAPDSDEEPPKWDELVADPGADRTKEDEIVTESGEDRAEEDDLSNDFDEVRAEDAEVVPDLKEDRAEEDEAAAAGDGGRPKGDEVARGSKQGQVQQGGVVKDCAGNPGFADDRHAVQVELSAPRRLLAAYPLAGPADVHMLACSRVRPSARTAADAVHEVDALADSPPLPVPHPLIGRRLRRVARIRGPPETRRRQTSAQLVSCRLPPQPRGIARTDSCPHAAATSPPPL
jgi:hypothetical protein